MKTKYHVNLITGEYGVCKAQEGKCPLGENGAHFYDLEETQYQSEVVHRKNIGIMNSLKKKKRLEPHIIENVTLPNASNLSRVAETLDLIKEDNSTVNDIAENLQIVKRQVQYYVSATEYLGFTDHSYNGNEKVYSLNERGQDFVAADEEKRKEILTNTIAASPAIYFYKIEGEKSAIEYLSKRHDMSKDNAQERIDVLKTWSKDIDIDTIRKFKHPSQRGDSNWKATLKANDNEGNKESRKGELCNSCFMIKPLSGICPNCDE